MFIFGNSATSVRRQMCSRDRYVQEETDVCNLSIRKGLVKMFKVFYSYYVLTYSEPYLPYKILCTTMCISYSWYFYLVSELVII